MSAASSKLLRAAAEIAGSNAALAGHLGIEEVLLEAYIADRRELPDTLLLKAVDVILHDRQSRGTEGVFGTLAVRLLQ